MTYITPEHKPLKSRTMKKFFTSLFALFFITQTMTATTIVLTEPNTLQEKIAALTLNKIPSLTVSGPIGSLDLQYIRVKGNELGLENLDLSGATLYADGNYYLGYTRTVTSSSTGSTNKYSYYYYISSTGKNYGSGSGSGPGFYTTSTNLFYRTDLPYAFLNMSTLKSIKLPKGMNGIGEQCFSGCSALTSITPTDPIINVAPDAFANSGITAYFTEDNGVVYYGTYALYLESDKTSVTFKQGTTHIADKFMNGHSSALTSVSFPSSLTSIGYEAFNGCTNLSSISLPSNIKYICDYAFYGCTGLNAKSLTIPASIVTIGQEALNTLGSVTFGGTDNLQELHTNSIPTTCTNTETIDGITYIGKVAFSAASTIEKESLWLREGTTVIAGGFFKSGSMTGLKKLHLPNTVTRLNYNALFNYHTSTSSAPTMIMSHAIKDVYIHSKSLITLDAPIKSQYRVTFHLLKSLQSEYASRTDSWASSASNYIKFDLEEVDYGTEIGGSTDDTDNGDGEEEDSTTPGKIYSVAEVLDLFEGDSLPSENVYVKGYITTISSVDIGDYGNATYYINDEKDNTTGQFYIWRGYYLDKEKFTSTDQIGVGDKVVVCGQLKNYNGTYEMASGNYIYSIEKNTDTLVNISNTPETAYTVRKANELIAAGKGLGNKVYVKGYITDIKELSTEHGNATYYIDDVLDDTIKTNRLYVYRGKYLENKKFTVSDQIKVGDHVIVYGNLTNYNGTYEFTSSNYIYSHNGSTTGITNITTDESTLEGKAIYNLSGRRVTDTPKKGVYIINGKKVVF